MKEFNFFFPITKRVFNGYSSRFVHFADIHVYGTYWRTGEIRISEILFENANIIPILEHFERLAGAPLFPAITDAADNHIRGIDQFFNLKTA